MKRNKSQMRRVFELHNLIQQGKYPNCSSFSQQWEVSSKTVQRDIDFLKDQLNAPIKFDRLKNGYYYTDNQYLLPALSMNEGEFLALAIGVRSLESYRHTPMAKKLERLLNKLEDLLPSQLSISPHEIFSQFTFSAPPAIPANPEIWETVIKGLMTRSQLEIEYNGKVSRVHPLHMANLQGQWYLFVRFYDYDNFKQLSLGRIKSAKVLRKNVNDEGFNIEEMTKNTFYRFAGDNESFTVRLRFSPDVAESVTEREWHPHQRIQTNDDGSVELEFDAKGDIEIKRWIMAWGRYCTILSPGWVKQMINDEVDAMIQNRNI